MMKIVFSCLSEPITFSENIINTLIIENSICLRNTVTDIHNQISGLDGESVLSIDSTPIPFSKNAELITSFVPFELYNKSVITKIQGILEKNATNEEHYLKTQALLAEIEKYLFDISYDYPIDVSAEKLSVNSLLKAIGISIKEDHSSLIEKVFDHLELIREFDKVKLFITVNMRDYFSDDEMRIFFDSTLKHKFSLLMLESHERVLLPHEKRKIVDQDLCEI